MPVPLFRATDVSRQRPQSTAARGPAVVPAQAVARRDDLVAFLVRGFPRLSETFVLHEFLELRRQGLPVRLVSMHKSRESVYHDEAVPLLDEVTYLRDGGWLNRIAAVAHSLRRHPCGLARGLTWLARQHDPRTLRGLLDALLLVRWCDEVGARHVHAHFATAPTTAAYLGLKVGGVRYSFTAHAKDVYATDPGALAVRAAAADAVVTCTDANRIYLERAVAVAPGKVRMLRHGIPLRPFLDVQRAPIPGRLLTVGRLMPKKGHDTVARALAQLIDAGRDLHWHIAGSGAEEPALKRLVAELGLTDRVRFLGSIPAARVRAELSNAQVFVLAPRVLAGGDRDGIPNVVLESMAAGVPVVATSVSAIPEVIRHGETGLLVEPEDAGALAAAVARLLDHPTLAGRLAASASGWVVEHCDLARSVAPLTVLLRHLAAVATPSASTVRKGRARHRRRRCSYRRIA